jgi:hypothetical protein
MCRPGHDNHDGRSDRRKLVVAMVLPPSPKGGEDFAWKSDATEGAAHISNEVCVDRCGTYRRLHERFFLCLSFPPSSNTTGVTQEERSSERLDSTCTC